VTSVSALIPVYNEREALPVALDRIEAALSRVTEDWEIVLVESGSTDGTTELCDAAATQNPRIRVVHEATRNGFGSALRLGFAASTCERVWIVPVDLPFPLETIGLALQQDADAVVSYRSEDKRSLPRRIQSSVFNGLARRALGLRLKSINSAFKVYRRAAIMDLPLESQGWLIDAEILYRLTQGGATIAELAVPVIDRQLGQSKVGRFDSLAVLLQLWKLRRIGERT
jgi:glycosyltransferase involved in cell wall biosynthesis